MKYFIGRLISINTKSLRFEICSTEITKDVLSHHGCWETEGNVYATRTEYEEFRLNMKATFKVKNPRLYDEALGLMNKGIIYIGIHDGEIISLAPLSIDAARMSHLDELFWRELK